MAKKSKKLKDEERASRGGVLVEEARAQDKRRKKQKRKGGGKGKKKERVKKGKGPGVGARLWAREGRRLPSAFSAATATRYSSATGCASRARPISLRRMIARSCSPR